MRASSPVGHNISCPCVCCFQLCTLTAALVYSSQVGKAGREEESVLASDPVTSGIGMTSGLFRVETAICAAEAAMRVDSTEAMRGEQRKTWRCAFCGSVMSDEVTMHRIPSEPDGDENSEVDLCGRCCGCDGEGEQPRSELHNNSTSAASEITPKKPRKTRFLAPSFKLGRGPENLKVKNLDKPDLRVSGDEDVSADGTVGS